MHRFTPALSVLFFVTTAWTQASSAQVAAQLSFDRPDHTAGATLRISGPEGLWFEEHFGANESISISPRLSSGQTLADGHYQ